MRSLLWRSAVGAVDAFAVRGAHGPRLSILIYHGVGDAAAPLGHMDVDREAFEAQLRVIASSFDVLPLGEAARRLHDGTLPRRAACITFDDGYANNATVALPMLERHGLRATFFVATAYLDGGRMFNDAVIEAVRRSERDALELDGLGLGTLSLDGVAARGRAAATILETIKHLPLAARDEAAARVVDAAGVTLGPSLMMTGEQVCELADHGMEIGGHTHRHPILESLPDPDARSEIRDGKDRLEALTGRPVTVFAYPNGRPGRDYSARHVAMAREAGFAAAVSTARGCAGADDDPLQLPRFTPWDRNPERFALRLALSRRSAAGQAGAAAPATAGRALR